MGKRPQKKATAEELRLTEQLFPKKKTKSNPSNKNPFETSGKKLQAAWQDEDDKKVQISLEDDKRLRKLRKDEEDQEVDGQELQKRLKKHFQTTSVGGNKNAIEWASVDKLIQPKDQSEDTDDSDLEDDHGAQVVRSTRKMLDSSHDILPQGTLEICRMKDANQHAPSNAVIQAVQFHPNGQMLLTAGLDKTLHLFQVDGTNNAKVENIFFKDLPITNAKFTLGGSRIVLSGPRAYFFSYDMEAGRITKIPGLIGRKEKKWEQFVTSQDANSLVFLGSDGFLSLASARSYEWIGNMKMNGKVLSATFAEDDRYLLTTGSDGQVYKWDMRTRKCLYVQRDEGSLCSGAIAASPNGNFYATGSSSGVVNVYKNDGPKAFSTPHKSLMQLTTRIDYLKFNPDSQILAMASKDTKDALKLVHVPSFTVFGNWPSSKTPLHYVSAMDFSPNSGYFACGNARGRVLLYRLTHYGST